MSVNPQDRSDEEYERLARLLSGEAGAEERAESERWLAAEPGRLQLRDRLLEDWRTVQHSTWNVESGLARLKQRIATEARPIMVETARQPSWWRQNATMLRAASLGIIIVGAGLIWSISSRNEPSSTVAAVAPLSISTAIGERRIIDLADGSQITLGPSSSASATVGSSGPREVMLTGEAFFRVTHDETRPFIVRTGQAVIEDLGTEFTVRALGADAPVLVSVSSGSVAVRRTSAPAEPDLILQPRDVVTLPTTGVPILEHDVDVEPYQAWTSGRLVFRNATFAEAIVELSRWYRADFRIRDEALLQKHLDVEFNGQSLDEVLSIIGRILDVRLVRRGEVVEVAAPERTSLGVSNPTEVGGGA